MSVYAVVDNFLLRRLYSDTRYVVLVKARLDRGELIAPQLAQNLFKFNF